MNDKKFFGFLSMVWVPENEGFKELQIFRATFKIGCFKQKKYWLSYQNPQNMMIYAFIYRIYCILQ